MSKRLSLAHIGIETANVALEDALLSDLAGRTTNMRPFENALVAAHAQIDDFQESVRALRDVLKADGYQMLETLRTMDFAKTGEAFVNRGLVRRTAWETAASVIRDRGGFYGMLETFISRSAELKSLTGKLREKAAMLHNAEGGVAKTLEENLSGNLRVEFAELYTAWSEFHALFLASALMCTESWYRSNLFPSL